MEKGRVRQDRDMEKGRVRQGRDLEKGRVRQGRDMERGNSDFVGEPRETVPRQWGSGGR
jgi:hypothetical protein